MGMISAKEANKLSDKSAKELINEPYTHIMDSVASALDNAIDKGHTKATVRLCDMVPTSDYNYDPIDLRVIQVVQKELTKLGYAVYYNWDKYDNIPYNNTSYMGSGSYLAGMSGGSGSYQRAAEGACVALTVDWTFPNPNNASTY
jgi:hypothetical protein